MDQPLEVLKAYAQELIICYMYVCISLSLSLYIYIEREREIHIIIHPYRNSASARPASATGGSWRLCCWPWSTPAFRQAARRYVEIIIHTYIFVYIYIYIYIIIMIKQYLFLYICLGGVMPLMRSYVCLRIKSTSLARACTHKC